MARKSEGWSLHRDKRHGYWYVRFRFGDKRPNLTTGEKDRGEALKKAPGIYEKWIAGHRTGRRTRSQDSLTKLWATWIDDREGLIDEDTANEQERYASATVIPFFKTLDGITEASAIRYGKARLAKVTRSTVLKELSAVRVFMEWCKTHGHIEAMPAIQDPPTTATGKSASPKIRVDLTEAMAEAFIEALPERTVRGKLPAQAAARFMWETSLRYETMATIMAPGDYRRGDESLYIRAECDKARYERRVPLTARAREALDFVCPDVGLIFGPMDLRAAFKKAALASGIPEHLAGHVSHHDLRHARITFWANTTSDLTGIAFLAGHKSVTTTAKYVHSREDAARRVLAGAIGSSAWDERPKSGQTKGGPKRGK
jgi:integrase